MQPIQLLAHPVVTQLLRQAPYSPEKLLCAWRLSVGAELARVTQVSAEGGVITVAAGDGRWHRELQRSADLVLGRLRAYLGPDVAHELHVVAPAGDARTDARRRTVRGTARGVRGRRASEEEAS